MAQFRFAQETKVATWIRDYYTIEAESYEEAIAKIKQYPDLEEMELKREATFDERDTDAILDWLYESEAQKSIVLDNDGKIITSWEK